MPLIRPNLHSLKLTSQAINFTDSAKHFRAAGLICSEDELLSNNKIECKLAPLPLDCFLLSGLEHVYGGLALAPKNSVK